ncbi:MAG: serine/threonine protein kinase [Deltaproteobacteria bacterium]|nr:serine/threonine protein kinase [Deltaproteobacteria bacterium]
MGCLDANAVQALMSGSVEPALRATIDAHLDGCDDCRSLVAALVRGNASTDPAGAIDPAFDATGLSPGTAATVAARGPLPATPPGRLAPGAPVGRYIIGELLGSGGMGVVYAADDPELARRVAVKLLRKDLRAAIGEARLQREAQAMARISHENVIAVYDVGTHDDQVFVAMELVIGQSLRGWLKERPRTIGEMVRVFAAAGRGLAAAHAAGFVHRDFKPDNVLVGTDGRVRVTDFGLARADGRQAPTHRPVSAGGGDAVDEALTMSGAVVGTPAYMAPEQHDGANVDTRSDQFGFCVALYEALYGERPFAGKNLAELAAEVAAGNVRPPSKGRRVPASLRAIVLRGLSVRPGDRFATMDELVAALGRDRTRVPRTLAWASLALAAIAAVGLLADWVTRDRALAVTRISFRAAGDQLVRSAALRYEGFVGIADQSYVVQVMRDVTGNRDQAEFGLGDPADDAHALEALHETLASADWITWAKAASKGVIAVGDYKGRLLYTSAAPRTWGKDLLQLPVARRAFEHGQAAMVVRGDDPLALASGLFGATPREGVWIVFARALAIGGVTRGLFIQVVDGDKLLADVTLGEGIQLGVIAPDGARGGTVPRAVADAGLAQANGAQTMVTVDGSDWLVETRPLTGLSGDDEIARMVLARPIDAGLAGLFLGARSVLGALTAALLLAAIAAALVARRASQLAA